MKNQMTIKLKDSDFEKLPKCKCGSGMKCIYYCLRSDQCNPENLEFYCDVCSATAQKKPKSLSTAAVSSEEDL